MNEISPHEWISTAAYYKAKRRNFAPGKALEDWLTAEHEFAIHQIHYYLIQANEDGITLHSLHKLADVIGIDKPYSLHSKKELIHTIQHAMHHPSCFSSEHKLHCSEHNCEWQTECKRLTAKWYSLD
ncbi:MAG: DUF2934 domain-containing protein [Methylovulum sp.]|jgi:hypothetical protein|nr:DUF2934 domain-containing protein [Methylovulum sp.]TSA41326.1 MAG: DUF2934 domain-containing protein [Methylococcaceae bacterium]